MGDHSVKAPLNIGIADAGANAPPALDISGLPVFTLKCTAGPLAGQTFVVTDPGRAMISGNCADIGKLKGPILRGLAARAPYFHNGSAATLKDVVNFYDQRFKIGFTDGKNRTWSISSTHSEGAERAAASLAARFTFRNERRCPIDIAPAHRDGRPIRSPTGPGAGRWHTDEALTAGA